MSKIHIPQPEPDLTPRMAVERARALVPLLREQQDASDARGCYSDEVHESMKRAGLYRLMQPRMFGGYEVDVPTYLRVIIEIGRGHPGAAWCFSLASAHALIVGSHLGEEVQKEIFGPDGDFRCPHRAFLAGKLEKVEGGYIVDGRWAYASGSPVATHFIGGATIEDPGKESRNVNFIVPKEKFTVLPDWGGGVSLGMEASGSNTVEIKEAFVPHRHIFRHDIVLTSKDFGPEDGQGARIHHNPIYLGVVGGYFPTLFGAIFVGAARAALEEFEETARRTRSSAMDTAGVARVDDRDAQAPFGRASTLTDCAEALTLSVAAEFTEVCATAYRTGTPIEVEQSVRLWNMARQATDMACDAVELLFRSSLVREANRGKRMQRYLRDVQMWRIHPAAQPWMDEVYGRAKWGKTLERFGR